MTGIMSSAIRVNVFKGWIQEQSGVGVGWQGIGSQVGADTVEFISQKKLSRITLPPISLVEALFIKLKKKT